MNRILLGAFQDVTDDFPMPPLHITVVKDIYTLLRYERPSPPKIQGCQIDQQIQSWSKDQLQDRIANKGMA